MLISRNQSVLSTKNNHEAIFQAYLNVRFVFFDYIASRANGVIVSANNPKGQRCGKRFNQRAALKLEACSKRLFAASGFGGDCTMRYREKSVLIRANKKMAMHLMRRYRQNGVYLLAQGKVSLLLADGQQFGLPESFDALQIAKFKRPRQLPRHNRADYFSGFGIQQNA
ncbi:DUF3293 domain-containing protein [Pseudoalteromonas sp. SSDWG2]|uniref:DUF3293 domain-containing protein n=1 Tax=Pseudoalteromonas sp. SSDWG2 TaxID=3139391 RepID=UPI003BAA02B5